MKSDGSATVSWESQSRGSWRTKTGTIIRRLKPLENAWDHLAGAPRSSLMTRQPMSQLERFLVRCDIGNGKYAYYTPRCSAVSTSPTPDPTPKKKQAKITASPGAERNKPKKKTAKKTKKK